MTTAEQQQCSADDFRLAMSRFPSGVVVVTAEDEDGTPYGFTASSLCSVSLDPPLLLVCLARKARSYPVFARVERFAISVLAADQENTARRFAGSLGEKFTGGELTRAPGGALVVGDALATLDCRAVNRHEAGDHMVLIGQVTVARTNPIPAPLVYVDRGFRTVG
ncbi:flavin reductase family protein [Nocardia sp. NPDC056541]|uniref:flavin reductase family protein n=1 Tax=Nocardia sp. NPDC056541 TaxID=3345860 RepID=UPI00367139F5